MTEDEWLTCADPEGMFDFLRGKISDRKLQLFAINCCRRVLKYPHDSPSNMEELFRQAVGLGEACVEGIISVDDFWTLRERVWIASLGGDDPPLQRIAYTISSLFDAFHAPHSDTWMVSGFGIDAAAQFEGERGRVTTSALHSGWLRDIFGNPFRPVAFDVAWRSEAAVGIASAIYDARAFNRLPILADALQEAGCENEDILTHCREPGEHVRGCWVVDLVLGK